MVQQDKNANMKDFSFSGLIPNQRGLRRLTWYIVLMEYK